MHEPEMFEVELGRILYVIYFWETNFEFWDISRFMFHWITFLGTIVRMMLESAYLPYTKS